MRRTFCSLVALIVCAIAPAAANAHPNLNSPRADPTAMTCAKDYSKNSANGDYCVSPTTGRVAATGVTCTKDYSKNSANGEYCVSSSTGRIAAAAHPSPSQPAAAVSDDGFSWGIAAAGAGAALVLVLAAAGAIVASRRRNRARPAAPLTSDRLTHP
jgi:hypothetical protein